MNNSKVRVTADQNGNVIGVSTNNPEYGYVRVEQRCTSINSQGWLSNQIRSALIKGKVQDLIDAGFSEGQELPGKIVVIERHEPFNAENPDRDLKVAGDSGVICRVGDQPIYRQTFYTDNVSAFDELIMHTNSDEIREVVSATKFLRRISKQEGAEVATL